MIVLHCMNYSDAWTIDEPFVIEISFAVKCANGVGCIFKMTCRIKALKPLKH